MPQNIFEWRIPEPSSKKTNTGSILATLPYSCTYRTLKSPTSYFQKQYRMGALTSRATVSGLGSSNSSGAEPSTAVGGPGIHQREGQNVHDNLKDGEEMHEFTWFCVCK